MPKIVDHGARREEIAEAVWRTIARVGVDSATVRDFAREAGVSTGLLAHYFSGRSELLLFALRLASLRAGMRMAKAGRASPAIKALRAVVAEALPLNDERRQEWAIWMAFWGAAPTDPKLAREQNERYAAWRRVVLDLARRCTDERSMGSAVDPEDAADMLVALIDGVGIQAMLDPERVSARRQMQAVDRMLLLLK